MKCPKCQTANPEDKKFCHECGAKITLACPQCGSEVLPGDKFCGECGHNLTLPPEPAPQEPSFSEKLDKIQRYLPKGLVEKILSQRDRIEGEKRQVTVMFVDMKGFTSLTEELGSEKIFSLMDQVFEILIHKVHDYEGTVNEMMGDGILALFGVPIALEDAPQRAIRSALAIHREMTRFNEKIKGDREMPPILLRIGINTGPVVVGTVGNDLRVQFTVIGDTINLASRMESLAEPGTTYVTEDTFKLTEGFFRFEALGEKQVKGKKEPISVYRIIAPSTRRTRFDVSAERGLSPFVGRERELELLLDGFERSKAGRGQAFSIISDAGVGKSRLLYEFRKAISSEDVLFLEGKCLSYSRGVAYHLQIDIFKANFDIRDDDGDSEIKKKVKQGLEMLRVDEASTLPYLLALFSVKDSGIDQIPMSSDERKDKTIDAFKQIVIKGSELRPMILAYEDLHWMDKSSEDVLRYLLEITPGIKVLLIFTYRPEFVPTWGGKSFHSQLTLNRLSNRESLIMVSNLLNTEEIENNLAELILEKTEGIPFFIEEFIRSLKNLKFIERKEHKYRLVKDINEMTIPTSIQDVIMARVDPLPEGAKEVLQTGSVIEREFGFEMIKRIVGLPEQELLSSLSLLKENELLYERGVYPQSTYIFKHALTQEVVYGSILTGRKKRLHEEIGQAIEKIYAERVEEYYEKLAFHYDTSGKAEKAVEYLFKAGEKANRSHSNEAAISCLNRGLKLLRAFPETPERAEQELEFLIALGVPLTFTKGNAAQEVETTYARACELCEQVGDNSKLFMAVLGLRRFYFARGELQRAHELGEQLLALAQGVQDPILLPRAHTMLAETSLYIGGFAQAREDAEQGLAIFDPRRHHSDVLLFGTDTCAVCQLFVAQALWYLGYPDQALEKSNEGLVLAQELSRPISMAYILFLVSWLHQLCRDVQTALERAETVVALCTKKGFPFFLGWATMFRGWAMALQSSMSVEGKRQVEEGIAQMMQGMADYRATGAEIMYPHFLALLAEVYGKIGKAEQGLSLLGEALEAIARTGEGMHEAEIYRLKGELLRQIPQNEPEAEACFKQAIEAARRQDARSLELRAALSLSRLWIDQGKKKEARELLQGIYGWFTEGFDTVDLKEAKALLGSLP
jgi:class 3 adenylate cyclase/predicted ATPase